MRNSRPPLPRLTPLVPAAAAAAAVLVAAVVPAGAAGAAVPPPDEITYELPFRLDVLRSVTPGLETCYPIAGVELPVEATGVLLNVTTVNPDGLGHVVVYPSGVVPDGSTVNFDPGQDVANAAFVDLGDDGGFCVRTTGATTDLILDLTGFVVDGEGVELAGPDRLLDTRAGSQVGELEGPVPERTVVDVLAAGQAGIPADAESVILNVTVTGALTDGNLRVFPGGTDVPNSSVVNFAPSGTRAAATVVRLSEEGTISLYSDSPLPAITSQVNVIIDVLGWTTPGSVLQGVAPARALDTRSGLGLGGTAARLPGREGITFDVTGEATGVPDDAIAVVLNLAAVGPTHPGNLRVHPSGTPVPETSTINYIRETAVANLAVVPLLPDGRVALWSDSVGTVDVVADVVGYVAGQ